jgi:predicted nucleic acid-binding protein
LTRYVLDASVAAKWFLPAGGETLSEEAFRLLRLYAKAQAELLVPDLFFPEFANIFWKAERSKRCAAGVADSAIREVIGRGFPTFPSSGLIHPALEIARAYQRPVYDCIYIALAAQTNSELVTADEKLANSMAGMPVVWLGLL